ncbi:threonine/serine dehydratase [Hoeflea sp. WL0058]|uniref:Threonine/serine dehydratase n=1 Tax=Flavimaribacter sediminis TaxID=2865987 RepID=A0AAE2ZLW4_9HYPH|nr:threonine/serine dehydratase [Flavimaribacter sediminis]MBW8637080.1 threonine/serine dehydratase [Flavimaribacter sediminis]
MEIAEEILHQPGIDLAMIENAAERIKGQARRTPLLEATLLNEFLGMRVLFKPECLQKTGSFKFRGAYTKLSRLSEAEPGKPVVAFSSGNHAQGVAHAAQLLGLSCTIVMPDDAPAIKLGNTRAYGANIVTYDRFSEDREAIAHAISMETNAEIVRPFDDLDIMSGQGTTGLEIVQDAIDAGTRVDHVFCPAGGGGLLSGIALAVKSCMPDTAIWFAEPAGFDDVIRSLATGTRQNADFQTRTICDALLTKSVGVRPFKVIQEHVSGGYAITDDEALSAMFLAYQHLKVVVEPGGAAAFAALLQQRQRFAGSTVVVVLSGGNVDPAVFAACLAQSDGVPPQ